MEPSSALQLRIKGGGCGSERGSVERDEKKNFFGICENAPLNVLLFNVHEFFRHCLKETRKTATLVSAPIILMFLRYTSKPKTHHAANSEAIVTRNTISYFCGILKIYHVQQVREVNFYKATASVPFVLLRFTSFGQFLYQL